MAEVVPTSTPGEKLHKGNRRQTTGWLSAQIPSVDVTGGTCQFRVCNDVAITVIILATRVSGKGRLVLCVFRISTNFRGVVDREQFMSSRRRADDRSVAPSARLHQGHGRLTYNLANFLRRLALPQDVAHRSLTTLREKLVKIGAKVTWHAKYVTFQLAEVAVTRNLFATILNRIARLAIPPPLVE